MLLTLYIFFLFRSNQDFFFPHEDLDDIIYWADLQGEVTKQFNYPTNLPFVSFMDVWTCYLSPSLYTYVAGLFHLKN